MARSSYRGSKDLSAVSRLLSFSVVARDRRTSIRLEPELWDALCEIAEREGQDVNTLVRQAEAVAFTGTRTSAVRVFIVAYFRAAANKTSRRSKPSRRLTGPG
jgi:predicted DNA-binding ribbon-helix-helix protein